MSRDNNSLTHMRRLAAALVAACLLTLLSAPAVSAAWWESPVSVDGNIYAYSFFLSSTDPSIERMEDGVNGTGFMGYPSYVGAVMGRNRIAVCDMYGRGSAIRVINATGIYTLAGSHTERGYRDGPGDQALFQGVNSGANQLNGLSFIGDSLFLADRDNDAVRVIRTDGTTSTYIASDATAAGVTINSPVFVAAFGDSNVTVFVSDSGNQRILTANPQGQGAPLLTVLLTGRWTGPLVYSTSRTTLYYTYGTYPMALGATTTGSVQSTWNIGNQNTLGYSNSLMLSQDQTEVAYFGNANNGVLGVYSVLVNVDESLAGSQQPVLRFTWPLPGITAPGDAMVRSVMPHSPTSYYVVTSTNVYIVSTDGPLPNQDDNGSGSNSGSSSGSGNSNSNSNSNSGSNSNTGTPTPPPGPLDGRAHGIGAFPEQAFPANDSCLMSQVYAMLRMDAEEAYGTSDYYTEFVSVSGNDKVYVPGDVNVSEWCGNVTSRFSNDRTIAIVDFWGPVGVDLWLTQSALADSPWTHTRGFLDNLTAQGWDLWPFCFYNCTTMCESLTASEELCVDYQGESECDDVCKGAIASSVVMACAGVVLIVLMAVNPANIFTALIMVPVI